MKIFGLLLLLLPLAAEGDGHLRGNRHLLTNSKSCFKDGACAWCHEIDAYGNPVGNGKCATYTGQANMLCAVP